MIALHPGSIARSRSLAVGALLAFVLASACASDAATLRVARDGSGDYSVIFDAIEAAASGDTIRIAAGVYPETPDYVLPGGPLGVVGVVTIAELTVIGEGADQVVVGPEVPAAGLERGPTGIIAFPGLNSFLRVSGISFRNLSSSVEAAGHDFEFEDCHVTGTYFGVLVDLTGRANVRRCVFRDTEDAGVMMFRASGSTEGIVEDCEFIECRLGVDLQSRNTRLRDCRFVDCRSAAQVSFGGDCIIERCVFDSPSNGGLAITDGAQVRMFETEFIGDSPVNVLVSGLLEGSQNLLGGGTGATMRIFYPSTVRFHGNHILNAGGDTIRAGAGLPPLRSMDLTENYWGTSDPAQVSAWILDHDDEPAANFIKILYLPMADGPIGTESTSMGELKSRFRGQD